MPVLTESDRDLIARARKLGEVRDSTAVKKHTGTAWTSMAWAEAFGEARELAWQLARRLEQLGDPEDEDD